MEPEPYETISLPLLLEYAAQLPASPKIFSRLSKLVEDENAALDYIASLVKLDPGLSAHILRITNSAFYASSMKVDTLEAAISRIGFEEIQNVLAHMVEHDCFYQALPAYGVTASDFSDRCIAIAVSSETIAKRIGAEPDAPYLTGLLCEIGKLAIDVYYDRLEKRFDITEAAGDQDLATFERETLGMSHLRAGYELLKHWQFDTEIWTPIKNLREPTLASSFVRPTAILVFARWITTQLRSFDAETPLPEDIAWSLATLEIDPTDIPMYIDDSRFEFNDRQSNLSMML